MKKSIIGLVIVMLLAGLLPVATHAAALPSNLVAGDLIKGKNAAVYMVGLDGKRYVFPSDAVYKTWFKNYSGVKTLSADQLGKLDLGGVMFVRPGTKLVKGKTAKTVYAVEPGGRLAAIESPDAAVALYGANWKSMVLTMPDSFMGAYTKTTKVLDGTKYPEGQLVKKGKDIFYTTAYEDYFHIQNMIAFKAYGFDLKYVVDCALDQKKVYDLGKNNLLLEDKTFSALKNKPLDSIKSYRTPYNQTSISVEDAKKYFSKGLVNDFFDRQDVLTMVRNGKSVRIKYFDEKHLAFAFNLKDGNNIIGVYSTANGTPAITKTAVGSGVSLIPELLMGENLIYTSTPTSTNNHYSDYVVDLYGLPQNGKTPYFIARISRAECARDSSCELNYPMEYVERSGLLNL